MESISRLKGIQAFRKAAKRLSPVPLKRRIGESIVLGLIFVFFSIPFAGMSLHCYKYGVPARFLGLVQFFTQWW